MTKNYKTIELFISNIICSLNYNRSTEHVIQVVLGCLQRVKPSECKSINCNFDTDDIEVDDDINIIYGAIVLAFGDYGVSPRYGWFDVDVAIHIRKVLHEIFSDLKRQLKFEQEH